MIVFCLLSMNEMHGQEMNISLSYGGSDQFNKETPIGYTDGYPFILQTKNVADFNKVKIRKLYDISKLRSSYNVSVGYRFNQYVSAELGFSYLASSNCSTGVYWDSLYSVNPYAGYIYDEGSTISSTMYRLMPMLKFSLKPRFFTPFLKAGLIFKLDGSITNSMVISELVTGAWGPTHVVDVDSIVVNYSGNKSYGFVGGMGVDIDFGKNFFAFVEGIVTLQNISINDAHINRFGYRARYETNLPVDFKFPFSSIGYNVGIKYQFALKKKKEEGETK